MQNFGQYSQVFKYPDCFPPRLHDWTKHGPPVNKITVSNTLEFGFSPVHLQAQPRDSHNFTQVHVFLQKTGNFTVNVTGMQS